MKKILLLLLIVVLIQAVISSCFSPRNAVPTSRQFTCLPFGPQFFATAEQILDFNGFKITYKNDSTNFLEARKNYSMLNKPIIATIILKFEETKKKNERNKVTAYVYLNNYSDRKDFELETMLDLDNPKTVVADEINKLINSISSEVNKNAFPD